MNQQSSLESSAYPKNKPIEQHSIFHQIIKHSITSTLPQLTNQQQHSIKSHSICPSGPQIKMRLTNKIDDIREIWDLQMEWFPLRYGELFYGRILEGRYRCLLAEAEVDVQWGILKGILQTRYQKDFEKYKQQKGNGFNKNNIFLQPSKYFKSQGIDCENLSSYSAIADKSIVGVRIIIGVMVFDLTSSGGLLQGSWLKQNLFGAFNSVYINTIGVIAEYRKHGVAKKMLEWLIYKIEEDKIFQFLHLHVIQYNQAAIKLYKRMGFSQLESYSDYYHIDNQSYTGKLLGLFLNGGRKRVGWGQWFKSFWKNT